MAGMNRYQDLFDHPGPSNYSSSSFGFDSDETMPYNTRTSSTHESWKASTARGAQGRKNPTNYPETRKAEMLLELKTPSRITEEPTQEDAYLKKILNAGLQIISLVTEHLVSHPFIVLRRQCQVNNKLKQYHLSPFTLFPVMVNVHRWQGVTSLWKGVGSVLVIKGITLAVQDFVSKLTLWPKNVSLDSSFKTIGNYVALQCLTCAVITPFYSASLVETVQSDIASEKPALFDVFKEGLRRLFSWGLPQKGRMLPVWSLVMPTTLYFIFKQFFTMILTSAIVKLMVIHEETQHKKRGAIPKNMNDFKLDQNIELTASLIAMLSSDVIFFPLETILHRLHLQGTRTIIDNLDYGTSVTPILTSYEGLIDCYQMTIGEEGVTGLYKGFGALILQCLAYVAIIKSSKYIITQLSNILAPEPPIPIDPRKIISQGINSEFIRKGENNFNEISDEELSSDFDEF